MNLDISFGQYCEGNSILHRMDPRAKIIAAVMYIVAVFLAKNLYSFALLAASTIVLIAVSAIPLRIILKSMKPLVIILLFTALINIFWMKGDTLLFTVWKINIYLEGIINAFLIAARIFILLIGTSILMTFTTTPIALTDGLEQLLSPMKKIGVPVHEFSMMMTIALRFIPTLTEETQKIMNAQKARGVDFTSGGLIKRAKALIPILIPLFISSFRRADELATAMECRCYHGGEGRTALHVLRYAPRDFAAIGLFVVVTAGIIVLRQFGM